MMKKGLMFLLSIVMVSCSAKNAQVQEYELYPVTQGTLTQLIDINGSIEIENEIPVQAPLGGRIEKIYITEGQVVRKGQKIGYMSSNERIRMLEMAAHKGPEEIAYWEKQLLPTYIFAPASGKIIDMQLRAGDLVRGSIASIYQGLIIRGNLDEVDIPKVKKGQKVYVSFDISPDEKFAGVLSKIASISTTVSNVNVYPIEISIDESKSPATLKIGMSVVVEIPINEIKDALSVSAAAVNNQSNRRVTVVLASDEKKKILLGDVYGGQVHVKEGLSVDDKIKVEKFSVKNKKQKKNPFKFLGK
ncbi:MAG: efflux RND transporter periplasmic adaptor subunit [Deltaproteobacteria bacterium]|nr:efflux RND transporter periplasmic adaptor subunit [Deltaproteobacteria bacterium]